MALIFIISQVQVYLYGKLGLKKFGLSKLWVKKTRVQKNDIDFPAELDHSKNINVMVVIHIMLDIFQIRDMCVYLCNKYTQHTYK